MSTEKQIALEKKIRQAVKEKGGRCLPGFGSLPRFIILMPGARVLFVETRHQEDGTFVASMQRLWMSWIIGMGFTASNVRTEDDFNRLVDKLDQDADEPDLWLDAGPDIVCPKCGFSCNDWYYLGEANYCPECGKRLVKSEYER